MRQTPLLLLLFTLLTFATAHSIRGVRKRSLSLYAGETFTCLDKSHTIPIAHVNDDFCDCTDGSDEPGTSACLNGKFYCTNTGAKGKEIPSSRVNDGICDCCDGTDEWDTNVCTNTCAAEGRAATQHIVDEIAATEAGWNIRQQWVANAAVTKAERLEKMAKYEKKLEERKSALEAARELKEMEEELEKQEQDRRAAERAAANPPVEGEVANTEGGAVVEGGENTVQLTETNGEATPTP